MFGETVVGQLTHYRGNAFLGLAHIARIDGELDRTTVKPIILRGLDDLHEYVRGHAVDAKEDLEHYLGWKFLINHEWKK